MDYPSSVSEAVDRLLAELTDDLKEEIRSTPPHELWRYHHSLGLHIRNEFGLWWGNDELLTSCHRARYKNRVTPEGITADDASATIVEALWERLYVGGVLEYK